EVPQYRLAVMGTENRGHLAVRVPEGSGILLVVVQLAHVRPEVNGTRAGTEHALAGVVRPALAGAVTGSSEPALVAAHHFPGHRVAGHALDALALVRLQAVDDFLPGQAELVGSSDGWTATQDHENSKETETKHGASRVRHPGRFAGKPFPPFLAATPARV